jgi:hypothetical protein
MYQPSSDHAGLIVLVAAFIGAASSTLTTVVSHCLKEWSLARKDKSRKKLLQQMLEAKNPKYHERWRELRTLMHVIGANEETTKRLLLDIGARASEDGQDLWGLVEFHPLNSIYKK